MEMTGLDASNDHIVSIGWVAIDGGKINLTRAGSCVLNVAGDVGQSACIHGIVDQDTERGLELARGLELFMEAAIGRVLVAHHSPLDLAFLQQHGGAIWGESLALRAIDTLALEQRRLQLAQQSIGSGALRLDACRQRYGLPVYPAHSAFVDALACAELLLAQMAAAKPTQLRQLFC
ncbi:3'-5' exonuclease [Shewanella sp. NIFS-20-20]|nr:3'-5' exonuclease [Shewanella sp. NIFS-20-20]MBV7315524.1 3'-5' exonuclease [Shewanella sp. NIFS-20-20]